MLYVNVIGLDLVNMSLYVHQRIHSLLKLEVTPHLLNAIGSSLLNEVIHRKLSEGSSKLVSPVSLLNLGCTTDLNKKQFEKD